jgi:hypothetical protein
MKTPNQRGKIRNSKFEIRRIWRAMRAPFSDTEACHSDRRDPRSPYFRISNFEFRIFPGRRAFVLIEVMLGVIIFAGGVLALGKCVNNCIVAESVREETERARLALDNRMSEVEAGETATDKDLSDPLGDGFPGMTMRQTREPVPAKNEKGNVIHGLYQVDLEVDWTSDNQPQARKLSFYVLRSE